jgi:hypothetical protein
MAKRTRDLVVNTTKTGGVFDVNVKGDIGEYIAIIALEAKGFYVFRNAFCVGPVDIIALCPRTLTPTLFDVKCVDVVEKADSLTGNLHIKPRRRGRLPSFQREAGVELIFVSRVHRKAWLESEL